jgi:hypothetical protein
MNKIERRKEMNVIDEEIRVDKEKVDEVLKNLQNDMKEKELDNADALYLYACLSKAIIKAGDDKPGLRDLMKELIDSL